MQLLVGDVENAQLLLAAEPAFEVVKPGAVVYWGGEHSRAGSQEDSPCHPQGQLAQGRPRSPAAADPAPAPARGES